VAKRSPILGYNHNVRYRGLVFHVQTEDSGLLNPHLFTHLFHEGVIVSTRKYVYDAGSNEEAIKGLMQAQHKAVMKDLRKGSFDDKIDQYLGHLPDLEARGTADDRAAARNQRAADAAARAESAPIEIVHENLSEPIELPVKARTGSGDRTIPITALPSELDAPTDRTAAGEVAAAINQANAPAQSRTKTAPKVSKSADIGRAPTQLANKAPDTEPRDSAPVIELTIDDDDELERQRGPRDTAVELAEDPQAGQGRRPASHGAATLPAMKQPSRPIAPVVTRPSTQERKRPESDVIEVYSPPPASAEPPPGERAERPGQYSMSRKEGAAIREKTGRLEKISSSPAAAPQPARPRTGGGSGPNPVVPSPRQAGQPPPVPPVRNNATPSTGARAAQPQQPNRVHATAPITNRTPSPATPQAGSGVVMTRPAVIVGAPPKQQPAQQRVRKAREDEGRGFGQGLISEKSLDEVILAYLSEDAEEK
jgi:hypothetical protein